MITDRDFGIRNNIDKGSVCGIVSERKNKFLRVDTYPRTFPTYSRSTPCGYFISFQS